MAALAKNSSSFARSAWCIGDNRNGAFGIGSKKQQTELTRCKWSRNIHVRNIHTSNLYALVEDMDTSYYSAGYNEDGGCTINDTSPYILSMTPITYFKENNIKISEIFVNNRADAPWWKSEEGSIYTSCDGNWRGRVGMPVDRENIVTKVPFLSKMSIKKIVSGYGCTIAICNDGAVYSTGIGDKTGDNGLGEKGIDNETWQRIQCLKNIVDCDFGKKFVIFLSSSGQVFSAGINDEGQLGLNTKESCEELIIRQPTEIEYFNKNNISIVSVRCCNESAVALDEEGNMYQWGTNLTGSGNNLFPQKIPLEERVVSIETGTDHCICRTEKGDFMSFGISGYGECCRDDQHDKSPQVINEWILNRIDAKEARILSVIPSNDCTYISIEEATQEEEKEYNDNDNAEEEEEKQNDEDVEPNNIVDDVFVVCVGIGVYDDLDNLDTASDIARYRALFEDKYHYKVIANDPSQRMTKKDVKQFLRNARKDHLYDFDDDRLYYDALIVTFGGHGTYDSIICSDGTKYKHKDLRKTFLIEELAEIPKIFLIDACRMDDDYDAQAQKARKAYTASTFSTTLMTSEGNPVYGAQICRFITDGLSESHANGKYTEFRTVYLAAKKRIRNATKGDQDLQLCEHDTDIESVVFKPNAQRGTRAKRYHADTKQMSTVNFMRSFLKNIGMEKHYDAFEEKGLLDKKSLDGVNKGMLIWLGIKNESSQEKILKGIKNLK
eukprot:780659_1